MKIKPILLLGMFLIPAFALAHGSKIGAIGSSVAAALEHFEEESSEPTIGRIVGVKGWSDGSKMRVKIYLGSPSEELRFECKENHQTDKMECKDAHEG